jgi:hypothetical protein
MSWSVSAIGKPGPVRDKLANDFTKITYCGPAETALKDVVAELVGKALVANTYQGIAVKVEASGAGSSHPGNGDTHQVRVVIEPVYGFVE